MEQVIVTVEQGKLQGRTLKNENDEPFYSFEAIPYAKPPIGPLRFKDPQPVEPWSGIRDATNEGQPCYAYHVDLKAQKVFLSGSEDCLFLNVFTRNLNDGELKPVMVYIHGGGFTTGSSSKIMLGPERLMIEDIVLVTINYRLGVLGFLNIEVPSIGLIANVGMKDMVEALKWIQKNIKQFRGDPNNVTIFGESAGASAVHYLVLSPMIKGLFHKAIMQSGTALHSWSKGDENNAKKVAKFLSYNDNNEKKIFEFLQNVPKEKLIEAQEGLGDQFNVSLPNRYFSPIIDGHLIPDEPYKLIKTGNYNQVPLIFGYTSLETLAQILYKKIFKSMEKDEHYSNFLVPYFICNKENTKLYEELTKQVIKFYFNGDSYSENFFSTSSLQLTTDNYFFREIDTCVKLHTKTSTKPVFYYRMSVESKLNSIKVFLNVDIAGAAHTDDLGYLFKQSYSPKVTPDSIEDISFRRFTKMWTNFARYSNPSFASNNSSLINIEWKSVKPDEINYLDIGKDLISGINPDKERAAFWNDLFNYTKNM